MTKIVKCDACGEDMILQQEEIMLNEYKENFGNIDPGERKLVCDSCYEYAMKRWTEINNA